MSNPVKEAKREKGEVVSAVIEIEEWKFTVIRYNGKPLVVQTMYLGSNRYFTSPPDFIKRRLEKIIAKLFEAKKLPSLQGTLM